MIDNTCHTEENVSGRISLTLASTCANTCFVFTSTTVCVRTMLGLQSVQAQSILVSQVLSVNVIPLANLFRKVFVFELRNQKRLQARHGFLQPQLQILLVRKRTGPCCGFSVGRGGKVIQSWGNTLCGKNWSAKAPIGHGGLCKRLRSGGGVLTRGGIESM